MACIPTTTQPPPPPPPPPTLHQTELATGINGLISSLISPQRSGAKGYPSHKGVYPYSPSPSESSSHKRKKSGTADSASPPSTARSHHTDMKMRELDSPYPPSTVSSHHTELPSQQVTTQPASTAMQTQQPSSPATLENEKKLRELKAKLLAQRSSLSSGESSPRKHTRKHSHVEVVESTSAQALDDNGEVDGLPGTPVSAKSAASHSSRNNHSHHSSLSSDSSPRSKEQHTSHVPSDASRSKITVQQQQKRKSDGAEKARRISEVEAAYQQTPGHSSRSSFEKLRRESQVDQAYSVLGLASKKGSDASQAYSGLGLSSKKGSDASNASRKPHHHIPSISELTEQVTLTSTSSSLGKRAAPEQLQQPRIKKQAPTGLGRTRPLLDRAISGTETEYLGRVDQGTANTFTSRRHLAAPALDADQLISPRQARLHRHHHHHTHHNNDDNDDNDDEDEDLDDWLELTEYYDTAFRATRLQRFRRKRELERMRLQLEQEEQLELQQRSLFRSATTNTTTTTAAANATDTSSRSTTTARAKNKRHGGNVVKAVKMQATSSSASSNSSGWRGQSQVPPPLDVGRANGLLAHRSTAMVIKREASPS